MDYRELKKSDLSYDRVVSVGKESSGDLFIKKYIFPGGVIPSLREIVTLLPEYNYKTIDIESFRRHYNRTLLCWRDRFCTHKEEIEAMMDKEFTRMWELYLTSCAAAFNNGIVDLHQILMSKGVNNDIPMVRK